jgi:hypothetical protein
MSLKTFMSALMLALAACVCGVALAVPPPGIAGQNTSPTGMRPHPM